MINSFYYPSLVRQDIAIYYKVEGEFYATYNCEKNYINISKDCQFRCVYCDAHVDECGGEHFSLDHFRPMDVFSDKFDGVLKVHPFNLHLSCQKCNVLKTNDWRGCQDTIDGATYISRLGYIDRFKEDISKYIKVDENGFVISIDNNGPGDYMIRKMLLNRTNRVYLRKRRVVKDKAERVLKLLLQKQEDILRSDEMNIDELKKEIQKLQSLLRRFERLKLLKL
nr:MAG TPA: CRISPR-associated endonuclease [Caudoviricetes sp.]